jgi:hypothetical protein
MTAKHDPAQIEEEREAFEAWFPCDRYLLTRVRTDRDYDFDATQLAWDAWLEATHRARTRTAKSRA